MFYCSILQMRMGSDVPRFCVLIRINGDVRPKPQDLVQSYQSKILLRVVFLINIIALFKSKIQEEAHFMYVRWCIIALHKR